MFGGLNANRLYNYSTLGRFAKVCKPNFANRILQNARIPLNLGGLNFYKGLRFTYLQTRYYVSGLGVRRAILDWVPGPLHLRHVLSGAILCT